LVASLKTVLHQLEPECLGLYWPIRGEFDPTVFLGSSDASEFPSAAIPFATRAPASMHYRIWSGETLVIRDECGIPTSEGAPIVPDVVLVPCVGFTCDGHRLGYGLGYFDRWLAKHPHVTSVGVAWSFSEIPEPEFAVQAHDVPLVAIVTDRGVFP
jgi:5,10-methenyltetrahydrofolate synthetase